MAYQLIWEEKCARAIFNGVVTKEELRAIVSEFHGNKNFDSIRYLLIDFIKVDKLEATDEDLLLIGFMDSAAAKSNPKIKVAMVVDKPEIINLLSSYENGANTSLWPIHYCSDINEANQWVLT